MIKIDLLLNVVIALIMFGIGLSLHINDFKQAYQNKWNLALGLGLQMIFLPFLAFILCFIFPLSNEWKVGLMILALAPGGAMSNFISYIAKADVALSIILTSINSFLVVFTLPLASTWALQYFQMEIGSIQISLIKTLWQLLLMIVFPTIVGLIVKHYFFNFAYKTQNILKWINSVLLASVFILKFFASTNQGGSGIQTIDVLQILPSVLTFHLLALILSFYTARFLKVQHQQARTIAIEVGLQNTTLAIWLSSAILLNNQMSMPALVMAMFSFFTTLLFGFLARRWA